MPTHRKVGVIALGLALLLPAITGLGWYFYCLAHLNSSAWDFELPHAGLFWLWLVGGIITAVIGGYILLAVMDTSCE